MLQQTETDISPDAKAKEGYGIWAEAEYKVRCKERSTSYGKRKTVSVSNRNGVQY